MQITLGETVVDITREGSDQEGDPLWSVTVDGLLSTTELLAVGRMLSERLGRSIDARMVTEAQRTATVRP